MDDLLDLFRSPRASIDGPNALISAGLNSLSDVVKDAVKALPSEYQHIDERLLRVWLSDLMIEAATLNRDREAGLAEVEGLAIRDISAALGQKASNGRAKAKHWRQFAEARKAANLTGVPVTVDAGRFRWEMDPKGDSPDDPQSRQADA